MKLLIKLVYKDLQRNRVITAALALFLTMSILFMAGGLRVTGTMISSMNGLDEIAKPPDYLQMHKGEYNEADFIRFAESQDSVEDALIVKMLTVRNANIVFQDETLERSLMDNSFVVQNEGFDFLLNTHQEIASVKQGEIGVPVYYAEDLGIEIGDALTLKEGDYKRDFTVSHIIRDSSMNAALSSSKRFLIHQSDLADVSLYMGDWEYLFEFLIKDGSSTASLEKDYMDTGLPSNGVAITGSQLKIINNISFGLVAFIIIAISMLLILIAVLCLSYIIRATMAEENRSIGEMKAIGFPDRSIERLYLMKYIFLVLIAGFIGYLAAVPFGNYFSASVILYCGVGSSQWMSWVFPLIGVIILGTLVLLRCRRIIRKNLKQSVVELLRGEERIRNEGHYVLPLQGFRFQNLTIALGELRCKWKEYVVLFFVFVFSSFLILLPMNMKNTVEDASFMTYMGVGESDIRIDIQFTDELIMQKDAALLHLEQDLDIVKYSVYQNGYVEFQNLEGEWEYLRLENGDSSVFHLEYMDGSAPSDSQEIAVSSLYAVESSKDIGDTLSISYGGEAQEFIVSGIYQDITYGGRTAKADIDFEEKDIEVYIIYLDVRDGVDIEGKTSELRRALPGSKITPVSEFVSQTLGGITDNLSLVSNAAVWISLVMIILITAMILQLITAREHSTIAVKKSIGFSSKDIRIQLGLRILIIQGTAILIGTFLANTLGEVIFGMMLSSMGASKIIMLIEPLQSYLLSPAIQLIVVFITVIVGSKVVRSYHIRDQIME